MPDLLELVKYNSLTAYIYDIILTHKCRDVEAFVFVATTGRSGSGSLARVFRAVNGAVCFHESYPVMYNDYASGSNPKIYFRKLFHQRKKINIRRAVAGKRYYLETNHQFVKNFITQAIESFGSKIRIIHLVRDPVRVGLSFYSINSVPGTTELGKLYLLDPNADDNIINISKLLCNNKAFGHDFYKCLWYWYEVETRIKVLKNKYSSVLWYKLKTDEINSREALMHMFSALGIPVDRSKLHYLVGVRANTKSEEKLKSLTKEECQSMHDKLLTKMEERYGKGFWV